MNGKNSECQLTGGVGPAEDPGRERRAHPGQIREAKGKGEESKNLLPRVILAFLALSLFTF